MQWSKMSICKLTSFDLPLVLVKLVKKSGDDTSTPTYPAGKQHQKHAGLLSRVGSICLLVYTSLALGMLAHKWKDFLSISIARDL